MRKKQAEEIRKNRYYLQQHYRDFVEEAQQIMDKVHYQRTIEQCDNLLMMSMSLKHLGDDFKEAYKMVPCECVADDDALNLYPRQMSMCLVCMVEYGVDAVLPQIAEKIQKRKEMIRQSIISETANRLKGY